MVSKWDWNPTVRLWEWNVPSMDRSCQQIETEWVELCTGWDLSAVSRPFSKPGQSTHLWAEFWGLPKVPPRHCFLYLPICIKTNLFCGQKPNASSWHRRISQPLLLRKTKCDVKVAIPWPSWQCPLWAERKTDFSWDRQFVSCPGRALASHQVGDQLIHEVSFRGPHWQGQHLRTYFSVCAGSRGNVEREELGSQVRFNDFIERTRGYLGLLTSFTGTMPPWEPGKS